MPLLKPKQLVRTPPDTELDATLATLPEHTFRLRSRDTALALPTGWRARFAWETERYKSFCTEHDSITQNLHGVPILRVADLRKTPPYPTQWTTTKHPTTPTLIRTTAKALYILTACVDNLAPSFHPPSITPIGTP